MPGLWSRARRASRPVDALPVVLGAGTQACGARARASAVRRLRGGGGAVPGVLLGVYRAQLCAEPGVAVGDGQAMSVHWSEEAFNAYKRRHGLMPHTPISERAFLQAIRREALAHDWLFYHTFDSRKSDPGFCDCVIAKPGKP